MADQDSTRKHSSPQQPPPTKIRESYQSRRLSTMPYRRRWQEASGAYSYRLHRYYRPDYVVNFTLSAPWTHADVAKSIAKQWGLRIESLPAELNQPVFSARGSSYCGSAVDYLYNIIDHYYEFPGPKLADNLVWEITDDVLRLVPDKLETSLSSFDELAGRLIVEAVSGPRGRLASGEYDRIVARIDEAGFKPIDELELRYRTALAKWNQQQSKRPASVIHTFTAALNHHNRQLLFPLPRAVKRRLARAKATWLKAHPEYKMKP